MALQSSQIFNSMRKLLPLRHYGANMVAISTRNYKNIENLRTSQGYVFRILQHWNFTTFIRFFLEIVFAWIGLDKKLIYNGL